MMRVSGKYVHKDFSGLLETMQAGHGREQTPGKMFKDKAAPEVTPEKRRRDSLMNRRNLRYVLSPDGYIHDRSCEKVAAIPDRDFEMSEDFLCERKICALCYRRALLRMGLKPELTKHFDYVLKLLKKKGATVTGMERLFREKRAVIDGVEKDNIYLTVNEDRWCISGGGTLSYLFHNNYTVYDEDKRMMDRGFHIQYSYKIPLYHAFDTMCDYTWERHLEFVEKQKYEGAVRELLRVLRGRYDQLYGEETLRILNEAVNLSIVRRFSLLYRYYRLADSKARLEGSPELQKSGAKIVGAENCGEYDVVTLRISRRQGWRVSLLAEAVKKHYISLLCRDYGEFCLTMFG